MGDYVKNLYDLAMQLEDICVKNPIENPKVTIIVPAYNTEEYIVKCLMSLVKQTLKEIEIIVIDDGSTDNTHSIACTFAGKDKRIKIITQSNQKQGAARNRGLDIARGEFIGFVDSDDWVDLDYFEKMYNIIKSSNANMAVSSILRERKNKSRYVVEIKKEETFEGFADILNYLGNRFECGGKLYKKEVLNNLLFKEQCFYEDGFFVVQAIYKSQKMVAVPDVNYHYLSHSNSTIKTKSIRHTEDRLEAVYSIIKFAQEKGVDLPDKIIRKRRSSIFTVKDFIHRKEYYVFGVKVFTKFEEFNKQN